MQLAALGRNYDRERTWMDKINISPGSIFYTIEIQRDYKGRSQERECK